MHQTFAFMFHITNIPLFQYSKFPPLSCRTLEFNPVPDCPQQHNGSDCGAFVISFAESLWARAADEWRPPFECVRRDDPRTARKRTLDRILSLAQGVR